MKVEFYEVDKDQKVIYPQDLIEDPEKHGGMGIHMALSIKNEIVTIPLKHDYMYVSIPVSYGDTQRILSDGGVDIHSQGYWCSILSVDCMFKGTDEKITLLRGLI